MNGSNKLKNDLTTLPLNNLVLPIIGIKLMSSEFHHDAYKGRKGILNIELKSLKWLKSVENLLILELIHKLPVNHKKTDLIEAHKTD